MIWSISIAALVAILLSGPASAIEGLPAIFDDNSQVKDLMAYFRRQMSELVKEAGGEARVTLFRGFQMADIEVDALQSAYAQSLNLTIKELTKQQRDALINANTLIDQLHDAVKDPVHHVLTNWGSTNAIIADFSWSKNPLIVNHSPSFVPPKVVSAVVPITISGQRLHQIGASRPVLKIGDAVYPASDVEDGTLAFVVPRAAFEVRETGTAFTTAVLTVFRVDGSWSNWRNWVPFHSAVEEEIQFPLLFTVLPERLGTYTVTTVEPVAKTDSRPFKWPRELSAEKYGGGPAFDPVCWSPEKGYLFDLNTVKLVEDIHIGAKDNNGQAPAINTGGIIFVDGGELEKLICLEAVANTLCTECGAKTEGHLEVQMVRTYFEDGPAKTTEPKPLQWSDEPVPLSQTASSQILNLDFFGELPEFSRSRAQKASSS